VSALDVTPLICIPVYFLMIGWVIAKGPREGASPRKARIRRKHDPLDVACCTFVLGGLMFILAAIGFDL
jgi:hypothetical protein